MLTFIVLDILPVSARLKVLKYPSFFFSVCSFGCISYCHDVISGDTE